MKKIYTILLALTAIEVSTSFLSAISLRVWDQEYLRNLPNYNWDNFDGGDGTSFSDEYNLIGDNVGNDLYNNYNYLGSVKPDDEDTILDYSKLNTGYQYSNSLKKQATTGSPLVKNYNFNGNKFSDYGIYFNSRTFDYKNSILKWSPDTDIDSIYNKGIVPKAKSVNVATGSIGNQDDKIKLNYLANPTIIHRSYNSDIIGKYNPYEQTILNWQDVSSYTNWGGSWFEGMVEIPNANLINQAHKNGKDIYGTIFLSGYYGLTKEQLRDFIKKDSKGNYLIVDILIKMCKYFGFDGFFVNNESNGNKPNGAVLDYNKMIEIVQQFNNKTVESDDENIQNLKMFYYNSYGTLSYSSGINGYQNQETYDATQTSVIKKDGSYKITPICLDFGDSPAASEYFLNNDSIGKHYTGSDIYNICDLESKTQSLGSYDFRELTYPSDSNKQAKDNIFNSITTFSGDSNASFSEGMRTNNKDLQKRLNSNDLSEQIKGYLYLQQINNLYSDIFFNGTNTHTSPDSDNGLSSTDLSQLGKANVPYDFIFLDPRIKDENKYHIPKKDSKDGIDYMSLVKEKIYDYESNNGLNKNSYGISDLVTPTTVIYDDEGKNNKLNFETDFSTGNGINFYNIDKNGNQTRASEKGNLYPWTSRSLQDILPTYQWNIYESNNSLGNSFSLANEGKQVGIDKMSGFYDYETVYEKGNSIALGSGFDEDGSIVDANWEPDKTYNWDIFGTNLASKDHKISLIYKTNISDPSKQPDVNFLIGTTNQKTKSTTMNSVSPTSKELMEKNGWTKITLDLNSLKTKIDVGNKISKIGLSIKNSSANTFKFNVGKLSIDLSPETSNFDLSEPKSSLVVKRKKQGKYFYDVRFSWNTNNSLSVAFYEIYYFNLKLNKYVMVGTTTSKAFYLKKLYADIDNKLNIGIIPVKKDGTTAGFYKFNIKV